MVLSMSHRRRSARRSNRFRADSDKKTFRLLAYINREYSVSSSPKFIVFIRLRCRSATGSEFLSLVRMILPMR